MSAAKASKKAESEPASAKCACPGCGRVFDPNLHPAVAPLTKAELANAEKCIAAIRAARNIDQLRGVLNQYDVHQPLGPAIPFGVLQGNSIAAASKQVRGVIEALGGRLPGQF